MIHFARRALIIGDRRVDKTGHMYEAEFHSRGVQAEWVDLRDVMRAITAADGSTLLDAAEPSPTVVCVAPSNYAVVPGVLPIDVGTFVVIVNNDFDAYAWVITDVLARVGAVQMNSARSLRMANNKWMTHVAFRDAGLPIAQAALIREFAQLENAAHVLGFPLVLKELEGAMGTGVRLAYDMKELTQASEEIELHRQPLIVEHYIECGATDKRVLTVNSNVVAAMERHASPGDFRANIALGGSGEQTELSEQQCKLVQKATEALGIRVVGMDVGVVKDMLPSREYLRSGSTFLIEANPMPGLAGLRNATGVDGTRAIVDAMLADSTAAERPVA